jgi:hypothetical protein
MAITTHIIGRPNYDYYCPYPYYDYYTPWWHLPPRVVYVPYPVPYPVPAPVAPPVVTIPLPQLPPGKTEIKIEITTPKLSLSKKQSRRW